MRLLYLRLAHLIRIVVLRRVTSIVSELVVHVMLVLHVLELLQLVKSLRVKWLISSFLRLTLFFKEHLVLVKVYFLLLFIRRGIVFSLVRLVIILHTLSELLCVVLVKTVMWRGVEIVILRKIELVAVAKVVFTPFVTFKVELLLLLFGVLIVRILSERVK